MALTLTIVNFIFNFLTAPFLGIVKGILEYFNLIDANFVIFNSSHILVYGSQLLILIFLFLFTCLCGYVARWVFVHYIFQWGEYLFHRTPFISAVYKTCKDIISTLFASKAQSFKQVVMVPFPHKDALSIGFVTGENISSFANTEHAEVLSVFVPTTPNPTSGYLLLIKRCDLIFIDMKIEDALKYVISCGVTPISFNFARSAASEQARNATLQDSLKEHV